MHRVFREPLFHFLIIAALLLLADSAWRHLSRPVVEISAAAVAARSQAWKDQTGVMPDEAQSLQIARDLATEEVFFRESMKKNMASDNRVRTSLIQMMRTSLKPPVTPPTDEELKEIRNQSPRENIMLPPQVGFEHVSFTDASEVPRDLLTALRGGQKPPASSASVRISNPLPPTYQPQIQRLLGDAFSRSVFTLPLNEWHGPITSTRGVHFVRVLSRDAEQPIPFEQVRGMLEAKWIEKRENETISREARKLEEGYRIVLPEIGKSSREKP